MELQAQTRQTFCDLGATGLGEQNQWPISAQEAVTYPSTSVLFRDFYPSSFTCICKHVVIAQNHKAFLNFIFTLQAQYKKSLGWKEVPSQIMARFGWRLNTKTSFPPSCYPWDVLRREYHLQNNQSLPESPAGNSGSLTPNKSKDQQVE